MKNLSVSVLLLLFVSAFAIADNKLYSYDGKYLGKLNSNKYDPESVSNTYGRYGSSYSSDSINNQYGKYGSPYSSESVNNPYATRSPRIYNYK
ncbi:MAG TPA: hypothetical protein DCP51_00380 [Clostridiales bacterium]|nr:MAG: hypothetical protein A2X42_04095 [Candidatus Margulisbacteria bacterium GWF2_38_17]OGI07166.1 MAG: hypothetical protein A2X41_06165 [Candidatus Margulisbacteria bacterium GWE2_39_32]HAN20130.1 hypothetical protein [Clostridiales bacterium]HCT84719.1 hypothetical protein [Candidatus Margulisiibacteriota bacterium]